MKRAIFFATLLLLGLAHSGPAAYLESDYKDKPEPTRREVVRPRPTPSTRNAVTRLVRRLRVGSPSQYRHLTVYPLVLSRHESSGIRTLDEALNRRWLDIREKDNAQVSSLRVKNDSGNFVFLMSGEILAGGKQNRLVRNDVLLPRRSGFIDVDVYCGEKERWAGKKAAFSSSGSIAHFGLRRGAAKGESQGDIWREIEAQSGRAKVSSPTRNYQSLYEDKAVKQRLDECVHHFRRFCGSTTVGAVAVSDGQIIGCDIFSDPALLSRLWNKLLRSYGLEAFYGTRYWGSLSTTEVRRFLDRTLYARYRDKSTPGAGSLLDISGRVDGAALVWDGVAVHVALFGETTVHAPPPPPPSPPIHPYPPYPVPLPRPLR